MSLHDVSILINLLLALPILTWVYKRLTKKKDDDEEDAPPNKFADIGRIVVANIAGSKPALFRKGEEVRHVKTGGTYQIVGLPSEYVLEHNREPAYAYLMSDGRICVRCQKEMEDGRFISLEWKNSQYPWWEGDNDRRKMQTTVEVDRRYSGNQQ